MKVRQVLNLVSLVLVIVVNSLANILPLNGLTTGEISDQFPLYFTPAGYVFSIWSVIYIGLIAFGIYQALPAQRDNPRINRIGYWFVISNLFNSAWIFLWHYEQFLLTLIMMAGLLISLLMIYLRLGIGKQTVPTKELFLVNLPFSIYLGWISVATVANMSVVLYTLGWNGGGISPIIWTELMILVAALLAVGMYVFRKDLAYGLVFVWASLGIAVSNVDVLQVKSTAILAAVAYLAITLIVFAWRRLRPSMANRKSLSI